MAVTTEGAQVHQTAVDSTSGDELKRTWSRLKSLLNLLLKKAGPRKTLGRSARGCWSASTPGRIKELPVPEEQLTGKRRTIIRGAHGIQTINDNFKEDPRPSRALMERWHGETQFELVGLSDEASEPAVPAPPPKPRTPINHDQELGLHRNILDNMLDFKDIKSQHFPKSSRLL